MQIFQQCPGDVCHVPAEAIHQVYNLRPHFKLVYDFMEPTELHQYIRAYREVQVKYFSMDAAHPEDYMGVTTVVKKEMMNRTMMG